MNRRQLADLLLHSASKLSGPGVNVEAGCAELARVLNEDSVQPENVREALTEAVYRGDSDKAEKFMTMLARAGYGPGGLTLQQPERMPAEPPSQLSLYSQNLLTELVRSPAFAAVILGDAAVGKTTLLRALLGARLNQPSNGITIRVLDFLGYDWAGLEAIENTVYQLPPRNADFLEQLGAAVGEVAREVQARVAQKSLNARSPNLGASKWPPYICAVSGWQAVSEELSLLSKKQVYDQKAARQLLKDFRYVLTSGPLVNVSLALSADRIENCTLTEYALDNGQVFAIGAVRKGRGGYRAIDALLASPKRIPAKQERLHLQALLEQCKRDRLPVVLALSGLPRLGAFNDFRSDQQLGELYAQRRLLRR